MNLAGKVVLLSACRTTSGELLQGENALGLVRAFFHAGARAVIASPWPLVDEEARDLMGELSSRLGRGEALGQALAAAKRARRLAGDPTSAWAGLQLHGESGLVVASHRSPRFPLLPVAAAALVLAVAAILLLRGGRNRRSSSPRD